jgi:hypothetical protein
MKRILAMLMTASLTMAACDGGVPQSVSSPSASPQPSSSATDTVFAVGGMIQSIEKPTRALSGALIQVVQGPNAGKSATSDQTGSFAIFGLTPGPAKLQVSKSGFQAWTSKDFDLQGDTKLAVELFPTPPSNASGAATGRCNDGSWTWATSRADACVTNGGLAYGVCPGVLCKSGM